MPPHDLLEELLLALFISPELVRFLGKLPRGDEILDRLPDASVSRQQMASSASGILLRRGDVFKQEFWDSLHRERSGRKWCIDSARSRILSAAASARSTTSRLEIHVPRPCRRVLAGLSLVTGLLAIAAYASASWHAARLDRTWQQTAGRTARVPSIMMPTPSDPARSDPHVVALGHHDGLARAAAERGDYYTARDHLCEAESLATALLQASLGRSTPPADIRVHQHNLAVVLESQASIEEHYGGSHSARTKRDSAVVLRERTVLDSHGDPTWSLRLAQTMRRGALRAAAHGDIDSARQDIHSAARVLEHTPNMADDSRLVHELFEVQRLTDVLDQVSSGWRPDEADALDQVSSGWRPDEADVLYQVSSGWRPDEADPSVPLTPITLPADDCQVVIGQGEAALVAVDVFAAEDAFVQARDTCPIDHAIKGDEFSALIAAWEATCACIQAQDIEDAEVRAYLLADAPNALPDRPSLPAWAVDSWRRAADRLTECRVRSSIESQR